MWNYFKIQSNKTFSWEHSSFTAHWQSATPSSLNTLHTVFQAEQPQDPSLPPSNRANRSLPFPQCPWSCWAWGSSLARDAPPQKYSPAHPPFRSWTCHPTSSGSISIYLLTNTIIISKIFIMTCMFACIFINTRKETFSLGSPKVFLESGYITFSRSSPNAYRLEE